MAVDQAFGRTIDDPRAVRALAHPVRLALLEAMGVNGPLTATQAGVIIGESATTCSFHLRQLAKYDYVQEAGRGPGRERPWRLAETIVELLAEPSDSEMSAAGLAVVRLLRDRAMTRLDHWWAVRKTYPPEWQEAARFRDVTLYLTAEELRAIQDSVLSQLAVLEAGRDATHHPQGALPAHVVFVGVPISLNAVP